MFTRLLNRLPRRRRLVCLCLLAALLAMDVGVRPVSAQRSTPTGDDTTQRYGWVNGGIGTGRMGLASSVTGGVPIGHRVFVGGRYAQTKELNLLGTSPAAVIWDAGPLVGLIEQGRWGHLSLGSGVTVVGGRRPDESDTKSSTLGIPLDVQAFFTPVRFVGLGVHGYANVNSGDNLLGWSVQLQVRLPQ